MPVIMSLRRFRRSEAVNEWYRNGHRLLCQPDTPLSWPTVVYLTVLLTSYVVRESGHRGMMDVDREREGGTKMIDTDKANVIYRAMQELAEQFVEWQTIGAIRETVGSKISRDEFDGLMIAMLDLKIVDMVPEDNQKTITDADEYNAVSHPAGIVWHLAKIA